MTYERFKVVRVPFPFSDRDAHKNRPALILSDDTVFNSASGHSVMAMITSAEHSPWPLDVVIDDLEAVGLSAPSRVRFKLFTLDHRLVRGVLGELGVPDRERVVDALSQLLGA